MKKIFTAISLLLLAQFVHAEVNVPKGYLIYTAENSLRVLNLSSRVDRLLCELPNISVDSLSKENKDKIILHASFYRNSPSEFICKLNLKNMELTRLVHGSMPFFISAYNGYYYFAMPENYLCFKKIDQENHLRIGSALGGDGDHVVLVDNDRMVYIPPDYESKELVRLYNLKDKSSKTLHIRGCNYVYIWRSATKQLLCHGKGGYFLTGLDGKNRQYINPHGVPVLYLPNSDDLIINPLEPWHFLSEVRALGIYNFKTGKSKILLKETWVGLGDAVYFEHLPKNIEEKFSDEAQK